jgi:putative metallohydrolase (TIGR04338 family)
VKFKGRSDWASGGRMGLSLPDQRWARSVHVIIHEMAHACHPNSECHGRKFCHSLLVLTREFEGAQFARLLRHRLYQTGALKRPRRRKK